MGTFLAFFGYNGSQTTAKQEKPLHFTPNPHFVLLLAC